MKVAHIGEDCKGGVHTYLKNVIEYQIEDREISEILVIISENSLPFNFDSEKVRIIKYPYSRKLSKIIRATFEIHNRIIDFQPDIVHAHSTFAGIFVRTPLFFLKHSYKIIYCAHGWSFSMQGKEITKKLYGFIEKVLSLKTSRIINISAFDQEEAIKYRINKEKCTLINNGVKDNFKFKGNEVPKFTSDKINLLFVGRFDYQKGIDILLKFLSENNYPNINLHLIGYGVRQDLRIKTPENVNIIGKIPNDEIDKYYQSCDAVIIPSRWEGFGLVAVEAMKNKKAIIVSDRGALPDFISNNNGYIFDLENLDTLSNIMIELDKDKLIKMGENGRKVFEKSYTGDRMNLKIKETYNQILYTDTGDI